MSIDMTKLQEHPYEMVEGEKKTFTVTHLGGSSLSSPSAKAYVDGNDVTSVAFTSGSDSVSGNVQTLKEFEALADHAERDVVLSVFCVVDNHTDIDEMKIRIKRRGKE